MHQNNRRFWHPEVLAALIIILLVAGSALVYFLPSTKSLDNRPAAPKVVSQPVDSTGGVRAPDKLAPKGSGFVSNDDCNPPDCRTLTPSEEIAFNDLLRQGLSEQEAIKEALSAKNAP